MKLHGHEVRHQVVASPAATRLCYLYMQPHRQEPQLSSAVERMPQFAKDVLCVPHHLNSMQAVNCVSIFSLICFNISTRLHESFIQVWSAALSLLPFACRGEKIETLNEKVKSVSLVQVKMQPPHSAHRSVGPLAVATPWEENAFPSPISH